MNHLDIKSNLILPLLNFKSCSLIFCPSLRSFNKFSISAFYHSCRFFKLLGHQFFALNKNQNQNIASLRCILKLSSTKLAHFVRGAKSLFCTKWCRCLELPSRLKMIGESRNEKRFETKFGISWRERIFF